MTLRIAVLDDDKLFLKRFEGMLADWARQKKVNTALRTYSNSAAFLADQEDSGFDIVFLDLILDEGVSGMDVAVNMRDRGDDTIIIFLTFHDSCMQQAFDVQAFQYLMKPPSYKLIARYLDRACKHIKKRSGRYYICKTEREYRRIPLDDMLYVESYRHVAEIHLRDGSIIREWKSMKDFERTLPDEFARCGKSYIVNLVEVRAITNKELVMSDGTDIRVGTPYLGGVRQKWAELMR